MNLYRVEIGDALHPISKTKSISIMGITHKSYRQKAYFIKSESPIPEDVFKEVFVDPIVEQCDLQPGSDLERFLLSEYKSCVEVSYKKGVTDNSANVAKDIFALYDQKVEVASVEQIFLTQQLDYLHLDENKNGTPKVLAETLGFNNLLQNYICYDFESIEGLQFFKQRFNLQEELFEEPKELDEHLYHVINLPKDETEILRLNDEYLWALNIDELAFIKQYYENTNTENIRTTFGMPLSPTDLEMEVIAQTWSEHCKHKIFSAKINYSESGNSKTKSFGDLEVDSLYKSYIKKTTKNINAPWCKSVFTDNAGIVDFDENLNACVKVETHNSPSALDPFGGSITGILGVNRDILGCGMGAKPVANTNVFCLAPNQWPTSTNKNLMPRGPASPNVMLPGVHAGVESGGNKSGIPTVNGAIYFDADYAGKPLVYVGTMGVMPKSIDDEGDIKLTFEKYGKPGDLIVVGGGAVGKDGIHGATFSSLDLDENSPLSAVQIGDPLTQKRLSDFTLAARDKFLFSSITDNGAGGLSSSVGEMAHDIGGAKLDLKKCPLKYPGLKPFEIMISESQERMTYAVDPQKWNDFQKLAKEFGVDVTIIGEFTDSKMLEVFYGNERVGLFENTFLHESLPQMQLNAVWEDSSAKRVNWAQTKKQEITKVEYENPLLVLKKILNVKNVRSKESLVRQYDHEVGGSTHIKPFMGEGSSPSDGGVVWMYPHGGEKNNGLAIACGLNPRMSLYDTYLMAIWSVDEAVRNLLCVGSDPSHIALLDNFCWPDPVSSSKNTNGDFVLAQLVRACVGLKQACEAYKTPLISGKDSMKNNFRGENQEGEKLEIGILPTLLITGIGKVNIDNTIANHFENDGDIIYLLGDSSLSGLALSELDFNFTLNNEFITKTPEINLQENASLYKKIFEAIKKNVLTSIHDVSDGGVLTAIAEGLFANSLGAQLDIEYDLNDKKNLDKAYDLFFNEAPGRFVVSVDARNKDIFEQSFYGLYKILGKVNANSKKLDLLDSENKLLSISTKELESAWKEPLC